MTFKEQVYEVCCHLLSNKIRLVQQTLNDLKESASNETKSTAGDKHETALAMLQIEQKNAAAQLENLILQKAVLDKIIPAVTAGCIANGTLVKTNSGYLFISIPLGKIIVDAIAVIALSPQSPLGIKLMRLNVGQTVIVKGINYLIESFE